MDPSGSRLLIEIGTSLIKNFPAPITHMIGFQMRMEVFQRETPTGVRLNPVIRLLQEMLPPMMKVILLTWGVLSGEDEVSPTDEHNDMDDRGRWAGSRRGHP